MSDPNSHFWTSAAEGRFELPFCVDCGKPHFFPRHRCPACGSDRLEWRAASGRATLYSTSTVHRPPFPELAAEVPYVVAIAALEEGPHLMGRLTAPAPIDAPLRINLTAAGEGRKLILFDQV
ncbi:Zn-ribbon domain-containing OB-fold protein [Humitalea sp. 24SJ18S-53]|uniref:Zn-ribbon domain-containing OB-fold protein n=1 Tax=Humitalea sp. 24SJ18S-53 TaxID=3422307 RepID=UPI003D66E1DE